MGSSLLQPSPTVRKLLVLACLVFLSLVPAVLLYLLFGELNSAIVEKTGLKLGGPVAVFFVALYALWKFYEKMHYIDNPIEARLQPLAGPWAIEAESTVSGRKATSTTLMKIDDGELRIDGGTFFAVGAPGEVRRAIGTWSVEMAVSDGRKLKYFYNLQHEGENWKGLVEAALENDPKSPIFHGTWQVLGKEHHSGTISLTKTK